jgi:N-acetylneuraminic acid mutarotase
VSAAGGKIIVAGGRFGGGVGSEMTDITEIYDPATGAWSSAARLLKPRAGMAGVTANGCVYAIGGEGNDKSPRAIFEENEMYNPVADTWQRLEPLPLPVHGITGLVFDNGLIYVPGGATARGVSGQDVSTKLQAFRVDAVCQ